MYKRQIILFGNQKGGCGKTTNCIQFANYLQAVESAYNEREKTKSGSYVNEYVNNLLEKEPIPGIEVEYTLVNKLAPNIPVEAVNQVRCV